MNTNQEAVIKQLIALLTQGNAHATFEQSVEDIPFKNLGITPDKLPYNIWQLIEHIRITQADILDFSKNADYKLINWPNDYWPTENTPADQSALYNSLQRITEDRDEFVQLLSNAETDIYLPFAHGEGQNLLREAMLLADHTSYHTGQIILIRRLLQDWD